MPATGNSSPRSLSPLAALGPGPLVAATGVGAGNLATASIVGSRLGVASIAGLFSSFIQIQKAYALLGALFIPALALVLLLLNGRTVWIGREHRNRPVTVVVLVAALALFLWFGWLQTS